jgi:hypothetical protein
MSLYEMGKSEGYEAARAGESFTAYVAGERFTKRTQADFDNEELWEEYIDGWWDGQHKAVWERQVSHDDGLSSDHP